MNVCLYNTIKWYWYGRLVNWFCHRLRAQSTRGCTTTIQSQRWRHRLARHKCTIYNSCDAATVSAAVATRSRADCSSMEGHTSLSTALVASVKACVILRVAGLANDNPASTLPGQQCFKRRTKASVKVGRLVKVYILGIYAITAA